MKICTKCRQSKPLEDFYHDLRKKDQHTSSCKTCRDAYAQSYRLTAKYRLAKQIYNSTYRRDGKARNGELARQGIKLQAGDETELRRRITNCQICGRKEKLLIDHDHTTGFVRGLLCFHCNVGIGHLGDNANLLKSALQYLLDNRQGIFWLYG